ncbi:MAG: hydroxylamine reductase, partial [Thermodesulfobacteriota bacterium]
QTAKGQGCDKVGVCGKTAQVSDLQDLLTYALRGLSLASQEARRVGAHDPATGPFLAKALFSTLTNVNFTAERFVELIAEAIRRRDALAAAARAKGGKVPAEHAAAFAPAADLGGLAFEAAKRGLNDAPTAADPDVRSLQHTVLLGLRGIAAYADHAQILGQSDESVFEFLEKALVAPYDAGLGLGEWVGLAMEAGKVNLKAMELLDAANTGTYGHPAPTVVPLGCRKGKCILVSGHDLKDLHDLLVQTEGKGITIYTHGEMLPTHGYPGLKKFKHFYGHYGTAWQNQAREFAQFPGAILMTTNCIQRPSEAYGGNLFTTGLVGWPGVAHVANGDFGPVIAKALELPGFAADEDKGSVMVGFGRNTVMGVAGAVIDAVKAGKIRHFFLVAGCDGAKPGRNYYTEFVEKVPQDCVVLTLACGKFRFFDKKLGDIGGIPRLLDIGQCNDAYSAIQIAAALAGAFNCGVNDLPLSLVLSWYEQKAVAILLTLLHLGIKDIRLGPSLPAFLTPNVLNYLVENFNIKPISTPDEDLKAILG